MINSEVQLFWANDENGDIAIIFDMVEEDRNKKYTCPVCGSDVKPVALQGKTKDDKVAQVSSHFSHFDASKCNSESALHWWFKNKILINGDSFTIKTDTDNEYKCKEVLVEQFYRTEFGIYRPDITIITECDKTIYFEMNYTNKKKIEDYMDKWLELGNPVVEVDIKMLMEASFNKSAYEFRALFYEGKCFNTKKNDLYYDTVGQFKERICKNNIIDNEIRDRIKKLDWFWLETINYKRGETNIEQLVDYIDYAEQDEKDLIFMILSKKRCVPIYEDYVNYKVDIFYKIANDYINNLENGIYKIFFDVKKIKVSRKNKKNIQYDSINLENTYFISEKRIIDSMDSTINSGLYGIKEYVNQVVNLIPYKEKSNKICSLIQEKYKELLKGVSLYVDKGNYFRSYLNKITLKEQWPYNTIYTEIEIRNNMLTGNKNCDDDIDINILDVKNDLIVMDYINTFIEKGLEKYSRKEAEKEERYKQEQEKLIQKIKEDKEKFKDTLSKISNIFNSNTDKIINYQLNYYLNQEFNNMLYFKDYRGIEFIVCSSKSYIHEINATEKSYYNNDLTKCKKNSGLKFIEINLSFDDDIYMTEIENSYEIEESIDKPNYLFPTYLNNPKINLSFKDMGYDTYDLPRYNFLNFSNNLNSILNKIYEAKSNFVSNYYATNDNKIYCPSVFTDENINKEIHKFLYPIIFVANKKQSDILNIKLNVDFTMKDGKKQPWLIKDFISSLRQVGIKNVHNII